MRCLGALVPLLLSAVAGCGGSAAAPDAGGAADRVPMFDALPSLDGATAGYALSFDGVKDYATAANGGFAPVGSFMTVEMWVKYPSETPDSGTTDQDFISLRMDLNSGVRLGISAGTLAVRRVYVDRVIAQAPTLPAVGVWHHIAYTLDVTNPVPNNIPTNVLYVDGVAVDTEMLPSDTRTPTTAWLGSIDGYSNFFKGEMDEVRIWTVTRTAAEVQADMHHRPAGSEPGLVAYWTFDDTAPGPRSADASGNGNDVTLGDGVPELMPARVPSDAPAGS
jgi:hypothetical protein